VAKIISLTARASWEVYMSSKSEVTPARIGLLIDYLDDGRFDKNVLPSLQLVADEYVEQGVLERSVEFVVRAVQGLPNGSFRAVRKAFFELVEQDSLVIFGPWVSENGVALRRHVEDLAEVACITMAASETMLGDWVFGLPAGSMEEEPIIMTTVAAYDGCRTVGIAFEDSLIGTEYLRTTRVACHEAGLRITAEVAIPQVESDKRTAMATLAAGEPDGIVHVGFGLGIPGMNAALQDLGWMPPRYTTTAFEFAGTSQWWREQLAGWIGLDQYDERNVTGRGFLDRFETRYGRRPEYFFPVYCYDVGRLMLTALANARPLTGVGVKQALEKIKMMPAASGAPGTRLRFGNYIRHGWIGSEFLVARRVLPDASGIVLHGTIEGLLEPPGLSQ
jgi:branched-chain amino acid transport system substrate-binding protein